MQITDAGGASFGRFQFTLSGGALYRVVSLYVASGGVNAMQLSRYLPRLMARDASLKADSAFLALLRVSAADVTMQSSQDAIAERLYWQPSQAQCEAFGLVLPLSRAYAFDIAINLGPLNQNFANALRDLGGVADERTLVKRAVERRHDELYRQATRDNLPGLRRRADFWSGRVAADDWTLDNAGV